VLRIQIRIGFEFGWIYGSASGSRKTVNGQKKEKEEDIFLFDELVFSLESWRLFLELKNIFNKK
jgi:hypothetical protein